MEGRTLVISLVARALDETDVTFDDATEGRTLLFSLSARTLDDADVTIDDAAVNDTVEDELVDDVVFVAAVNNPDKDKDDEEERACDDAENDVKIELGLVVAVVRCVDINGIGAVVELPTEKVVTTRFVLAVALVTALVTTGTGDVVGIDDV